MRNTIIKQLAEIEFKQNVKILYACEVGSRATGLNKEYSDYDVRFVYIHPLDWYLSIAKKDNVINLPINHQLDVHGWDLQKALVLLKKSNPTLLEWLFSPLIYCQNKLIIDQIRKKSQSFFSAKATVYHYLHMAERNYKHIDKSISKSYINVLRPILACLSIEKNNTFPPLEFKQLLSECVSDEMIKKEIVEIIKCKKGQQGMPNFQRLNEFIETNLIHLNNIVSLLPTQRNTNMTSDLDQIFLAALMNAWSIKLY